MEIHTEQGLHARRHGDGERAVAILHGLLGAGANWGQVARVLAGPQVRVYCIDARNHGHSYHDERHDYNGMADDLLAVLQHEGLKQVDVIGHSMGGISALHAAALEPDRIARLVIADIAPRAYHSFAYELLDDLQRLDLTGRSRREVAAQLTAAGHARDEVRFLLTNLRSVPGSHGKLQWRVNLPALQRFTRLMERYTAPDDLRCPQPCLFLRGGSADFITADDESLIRRVCPQAEVRTIEGAGHWVHIDQRDAFCREVEAFLQLPGADADPGQRGSEHATSTGRRGAT